MEGENFIDGLKEILKNFIGITEEVIPKHLTKYLLNLAKENKLKRFTCQLARHYHVPVVDTVENQLKTNDNVLEEFRSIIDRKLFCAEEIVDTSLYVYYYIN
uniref:Uncharacterized protein n=1 Tax=Meloidogyne hapla TaxID=6305 RepID=A0A1I8BG85_MELHA